MLHLSQKAMGQLDLRAETLKAVAPFGQNLPNICQVLRGEFDKEGKVIVSPGGVRLFVNGERIKICISGQGWLSTGYVTLPEELPTLELIDAALGGETIEWSQGKPIKSGSTDIPY